MKSKAPYQPTTSSPTQLLVTTLRPTRTGLVVTPSHDDLAKLAYLIYLNQGRLHGRDVAHWLEAEAQVTVSADPKRTLT